MVGSVRLYHRNGLWVLGSIISEEFSMWWYIVDSECISDAAPN